VLSAERCRQLLAEHHVGRVAWEGADGLQLLPVSYAFHRNAVIFRTSPYGVLSELVHPADVVFEVDELDTQSRTGWSVVVAGRAQAVAEPRDLVQLWTVDGLTPWAEGVRTLFIEVTPRKITGRLFGPMW
jgi:nitroimidazol reductase NimA-like FMN-containing flavoprotein (pyridoxamine 5'-phosphate oxidase superfamily)